MSRPLPPGDPVTHPGDKDSDHHGTDPDREDMAAGGVLGHGVASKPYPDLIHWAQATALDPTTLVSGAPTVAQSALRNLVRN